jgi:hypothetical protein
MIQVKSEQQVLQEGLQILLSNIVRLGAASKQPAR